MPDPLTAVHERLDEQHAAAVDRLRALLAIPSISTDEAFDAEVRRAADHVAGDLSSLGLDATVHDTPGHPMVVAHDPGPGDGAPHVLYYGHYDVQPPDPLELWDHDPFDATIVEGPHGPRIVARGACDDKGQLMTFVEAFRAWKAVHGTLPVRVTVLLEGEEESGSQSLDAFLVAHRDELAADVGVVTDSGMWDIDTPAITTMLRGLVYLEATLHGPSHDLHSGVYGGAVLNPNNALARILAALHDEDGAVTIPGFYDDVRPVPDDVAAQWEALGFDEPAFLGGVGLAEPAGERGRSALQRMWARPTCDVNGMWGGYSGPGAKTVIPAHASAKISCRLVADQDPDTVEAALLAFLKGRTPPDFRWTIDSHGASPAISVPTDSRWVRAAARGLERIWGRPPVLMGCGGSIPAVGSMQRLLGFDSLLVGFALEDDRFHSPNEKYELVNFQRGAKAQAAMLAAFAEA